MTDLPDFLKPRLLVETYENLFENALNKVILGQPLKRIIMDDPRGIDPAIYLRWVNADPERKRRYQEAREIGATCVEDELVAIADGGDDGDDVQRATLRINTRKWLLGVWDRKRYGDVKQIDMNVQSISITRALEQAEGRLIENDQ